MTKTVSIHVEKGNSGSGFVAISKGTMRTYNHLNMQQILRMFKVLNGCHPTIFEWDNHVEWNYTV